LKLVILQLKVRSNNLGDLSINACLKKYNWFQRYPRFVPTLALTRLKITQTRYSISTLR
jgi:hypothetical protein